MSELIPRRQACRMKPTGAAAGIFRRRPRCQIAQARASMRQENGIEQLALSRVQSSGEMFGDMAFGIEQRLCDHPFDGTDARHNDAPSPTLIQ